ncbi:DUF2247 family protein [Arthrobacter sp. RCC_34]|uniref:DUF2247 family protein n=1 Tax=Arthrobacter sp. RCC_34 TaxID=3239230 RepID=UPI003526971C
MNEEFRLRWTSRPDGFADGRPDALVNFRIPAVYVAAKAIPATSEIVKGYLDGWIDVSDVVHLAEKFGEGSPLGEELSLLLSYQYDEVPDLIRESTHTDARPGEEARRLWLYLALSWVRDHEPDFDEPLRTVEMLFADFDYPDDVAPFADFMPTPQGEEPGVRGLYARWRAYLDREEAYFKRDRR